MKMRKPERFMESGGMKLGISSANLVCVNPWVPSPAMSKPDVVARACNPSTPKVVTRGSKVPGHMGSVAQASLNFEAILLPCL